MRARRFLTTALPLLLCVPLAGGREAGAQEKTQKRTAVVVEQDAIVVAPHDGPVPRTIVRGQGVGTGGGDNTFVFVSSEMTIDGKVVKGAPYSAEAVTETTQVFADGNRIVRKNTAQVYRDGEGRTRREQTIGMIGPFAAGGDPPQTVFIHDPVSGDNYILDARTKTARKVRARVTFEREAKREAEVEAKAKAMAHADSKHREKVSGYTFQMPAPGPGGPDIMFYSTDGREPKVEQLGESVVEGVKATGKRVTVTIPAGSIGNERDIDIVTERWQSTDLQTVVKTSHSDPRFGTTVYRLTNISRTEPAPSLFQLPSDYTVKEGPAAFGSRPFRVRRPEQKENFFFEFNTRPEQN